MKKSFEYDLTKYDPSAPKKTEEFLTADGVKTLTTDANDGAVLIQDEVDEDSLNPVTGAAVAAAIEAGGGGTEYSAGDGISIADDTISAKVDGTTIQVNASGELEAIGGGGGGSEYSNGDCIYIEENHNTINLSANYGADFSIEPGAISSTTVGSATTYREFYFPGPTPDSSGNAMCRVKFNQSKDQITITGTSSQRGHTVRVALGCEDDFGSTIFYVSSSDLIDSDYSSTFVLDGSSDSTILTGELITGYSINYFSSVFTTVSEYADYNSVNRAWLVAYDTSTDQVIGDPLGIGTDVQFIMENNFNPSKLKLNRPLPSWDTSDPSEDAGKSLQVQSNGTVAWATAGGGTTVIANDVTLNWNSIESFCYYDVPAASVPAITTGVYLVRFSVAFTSSTPPSEFTDMSAPACITAGIWSNIGGQWGFDSKLVLLPSTNGAGTARGFEGTGVFTIDDSSFVPTRFRVQVCDQAGHNVTTVPNTRKYTLIKIG